MAEIGRMWPPLTLVLVSAASMALEIVAGRALAPYVGMSLYTWTVIIAVVLAGLSLGHWIGGVLADRGARRWVAGLLVLAAGLTLVSLWLMRGIAPLLTGSDPVEHAGGLAMTAFFLPSVVAGAVSPLLTTLALDAAPSEARGRVLGLMYALGAGGAILGTLAAGLVLIAWAGTSGSVALIGGLYAILSVPYWRGRAGVAALLVLAGLGWATAVPPSCTVESAYYCIRVDDTALAGRPARVLALDHLAHGINDQADAQLLLSPYVHGVDEIVRARFSQSGLRAFFIGGGALTLPRAWAARDPEARLVVAEVDDAVIRVARERLWADGEMQFARMDARVALRHQPPEARFDVIFGDAFHDISIPPHLVSDEFHAEIAGRLSADGLYLINAVDSVRSPRFVLSLARTLRRRFRHVSLWLDLETVQTRPMRTTWIVAASNTPVEGGELQSTHGIGRLWVRVPIDRMVATMPEDSLVILTDDFAPVDRLLEGVLLSADAAE